MTVITNIDRVFGETGHLLARLNARRRRRVIIYVEPSRTRRGHREQNIFVGAAAAKMAGESRADVFSRRGDRALCLPPIVMESRGSDNKPGRTEAALQRIERHEGLLYRMQSAGTHAFDCRDSFPRDGVGRKQTARNRNAVEQHRAGSADARAAHQLCARETEIVTQDIDQKGLWVVGQGLSTTVDVHCPHTDFPLTWDTTRSGTIAPAIKRRIIRG